MEVNGVTMAHPNPVGIPRIEGHPASVKSEHSENAGVATPGQQRKEAEAMNQEKIRESIEEREKLVLRPSEVSIEDRMKQVISIDDMKRLLYMYSPYGLSGRPEETGEQGHLVDVKM